MQDMYKLPKKYINFDQKAKIDIVSIKILSDASTSMQRHYLSGAKAVPKRA